MTEERKAVETTESQIKLAKLIKESDIKNISKSDAVKATWTLEKLLYSYGAGFVLDKVLESIVPKESLKWYERVLFWFGKGGISALLGWNIGEYWDSCIDDLAELIDKLDEWADETLRGNKNDMKGLS